MDVNEFVECINWIDRCLFPEDFINDLVSLGMDIDLANHIIWNLYKTKQLSIMNCYKYFRSDMGDKNIILKYITNNYKNFQLYKSGDNKDGSQYTKS